MKISSSVTGHTARLIGQLEEALLRGNAHAAFEDAVAGIPYAHLGETPGGLPYSIWQLAEHIRISQWDILEFCRDPQHKSPPWPEGYWPGKKMPGSATDFKRSVEHMLADRQAFIGLLHEAAEEVYTPFPYGDGQDLVREAILLIDHTSYHVGEILVLRRLLGDWK
ncbi:MAG TPA: DinB family protein [Puia sp.]|nr:DinB family protein [Puia sp.]